ncbi:hypothetical protein [uncultured Clostridium sp.]|uniref:hypothetical protein n=1 Tax=uncultured Clostridium sp. TaxID=59620 RepID=UPI002611852C|nr:hypothetical protein [uncultured Clostridium sp.]
MNTENNENTQNDEMIEAYFNEPVGEGVAVTIDETPKGEVVEELKSPVDVVITEEVKPTVVIPETVVITEEVKPEFTLDDKGRWVLDKLSKGEDKDIYDLLKDKFAYEGLSEEDKIFTYLAEKHPHLTHEDLVFKAGQEFGIGVTHIDEDDMTPEIRTFLRKQEIDRKGLISEATNFFKEKSAGVEIPSLPNVLDLDAGYKEYMSFRANQEQIKADQLVEQEKNTRFEEETTLQINNTAKEIETLSFDLKIDLDQGEFDLKSEFKLDEAKRKELADYAIEHVPTQSELKAFQNQNGELDMKGYMTSLATKLFSNQIQKAMIKQAIAKDREEFNERELKNSTLRNSTTMIQSDVAFDFHSAAMGD